MRTQWSEQDSWLNLSYHFMCRKKLGTTTSISRYPYHLNTVIHLVLIWLMCWSLWNSMPTYHHQQKDLICCFFLPESKVQIGFVWQMKFLGLFEHYISYSQDVFFVFFSYFRASYAILPGCFFRRIRSLTPPSDESAGLSRLGLLSDSVWDLGLSACSASQSSSRDRETCGVLSPRGSFNIIHLEKSAFGIGMFVLETCGRCHMTLTPKNHTWLLQGLSMRFHELRSAACAVGWWREWAVGESALKWTMRKKHLVVWVNWRLQ